MKQKKINIKGRTWTIKWYKKEHEDLMGTTDCTSKIIRIFGLPEALPNRELDNKETILDQVLRHELLHAFLYECGIDETFYHPSNGHDEFYINWFSLIYHDYKKVCNELGV